MSPNSTLYYGCRSRVPNLGGNANNGSNCGFAYANFENDPANSNPNIGSRNCKTTMKNKVSEAAPLGGTRHNLPAGPVAKANVRRLKQR